MLRRRIEYKKEKDIPDVPEDQKVDIEKSDVWAMLISGFLTVFLPIALIILLIAGVTLLIFGR